MLLQKYNFAIPNFPEDCLTDPLEIESNEIMLHLTRDTQQSHLILQPFYRGRIFLIQYSSKLVRSSSFLRKTKNYSLSGQKTSNSRKNQTLQYAHCFKDKLFNAYGCIYSALIRSFHIHLMKVVTSQVGQISVYLSG